MNLATIASASLPKLPAALTKQLKKEMEKQQTALAAFQKAAKSLGAAKEAYYKTSNAGYTAISGVLKEVQKGKDDALKAETAKFLADFNAARRSVIAD